MKQNILLTFAKPYRMENDQKTGFNEGVSLSYFFTDSLLPVSSEYDRGIRSSKNSISLEKSKSILKVPGLYEAEFDISVDAKGKNNLKLLDLKFLSEVSVMYPGLKS